MNNSAVWAILGVIVGTLTSGLVNWLLQKNQFRHNIDMIRIQNKSADFVKELLTEMLNHRSYTDRSFTALKIPIGGYTDDEIRKFLHDVDAKKTIRDDGSEWWYLKSRNEERIAKKMTTC